MRAVELILDDRRVVGVRFRDRATGSVDAGARRGVIIATGGFRVGSRAGAGVRPWTARALGASVPTNTAATA